MECTSPSSFPKYLSNDLPEFSLCIDSTCLWSPSSSRYHWHPIAWECLSPEHKERKRTLSFVDLSWDTPIHCPLFSLKNLSSPEKLQPWTRLYTFYSGPLADRSTLTLELPPDPGCHHPALAGSSKGKFWQSSLRTNKEIDTRPNCCCLGRWRWWCAIFMSN